MDLVNCEVVTLVSLLVISTVGCITQVDISLFSPHDKRKTVNFGKVKTQPAPQACETALVFFVLVLLIHKLELVDFLAFEKIFHKKPIQNSPVAGYAIKVQFLGVLVPLNRPNGVCVLFASDT